MIDQHDSYRCALCRRPIHETEGALCVVCRWQRMCEQEAQREQELADDLVGVAPLLAEHPKMIALWYAVKGGLISDWESGEPHHAFMQTNAEEGIYHRNQRWDAVYTAALAAKDVPLADPDLTDSPWDALAQTHPRLAVGILRLRLMRCYGVRRGTEHDHGAA